MEEKITLYLVDDEDAGLESMESFIDSFFIKNNFEIECFHWAMKRSALVNKDPNDPNDKIAIEAFPSKVPHIVITDINFQRELQTDGIDLFKQIKIRYPKVEVIGVTKNPTRNERDLVAQIDGFDCFDKECNINIIKDRFISHFIKVAKQLIESIDNPNEIISKIRDNPTEIPDLQVMINSKTWLGKHIFAPYYEKSLNQYNINEIIDELVPNFSLKASECFGIDGYKQATHDLSQGYFTGDWYNNLLENLFKLSSMLNNNGNNTNDELVKYKNVIDGFTTDLINLEKIEEAKKQVEVRRINNKKVHNDFRIGTSTNAKRKFLLNNQELQRALNLGGNEFEVYLPIDKIFEKNFTFLMSKTCLLGCFSHKTNQKLERNPITWVNGKQPILCKEYLIFYIENEFNNNFNSPDFITNFYSGKFEYFGKIYLYLCQNAVWNLLDMTYKKNNVTIDSIPNELILNIKQKQPEAKTFIIFEFHGWRQP